MNRLRSSPLWMVFASIASVQVGAAFAKSAFPDTGPLGMAWLRFVCAGVILLVFARPRLRWHQPREWLWLAAYCLALTTMNISIYQAMARIPLGMAVTIEFLGPLTVAVITRHGKSDLIWVLLAGVGVALLGWSPGSLTWAGVLFALLAAACWGAYILITPVVGRHWTGAQPVTMANLLGAVVLAVPVLLTRSSVLMDWKIWALGLGVGLLSSAIPYALELVALQRIKPTVFSILMSVEPAVAALAGLIILSERIGWVECVAMACIMAASIGVSIRVRGVQSNTPAPTEEETS